MRSEEEWYFDYVVLFLLINNLIINIFYVPQWVHTILVLYWAQKWLTCQHVNGFSIEIAIFIKSLNFQSSNYVNLMWFIRSATCIIFSKFVCVPPRWLVVYAWHWSYSSHYTLHPPIYLSWLMEPCSALLCELHSMHCWVQTLHKNAPCWSMHIMRHKSIH